MLSLSVQFSHSVVSHFATPWTAACQASLSITSSQSLLKSCPLSQWCHPTISSSVIPVSCLQSFPASGSFPVSHFLSSVGQSVEASASSSVLPVNIQDWFPNLGLTGCSPCSPRDLQESSSTPQFKIINSSALSLLYGPALTSLCDY